MPESSDPPRILLELLQAAIDFGADRMEVESESGYEIVYARKGDLAVGIVEFPSDSSEAEELTDELWKRRRKKSKVDLDGTTYVLKVETWDSFGETAYRVQISPS